MTEETGQTAINQSDRLNRLTRDSASSTAPIDTKYTRIIRRARLILPVIALVIIGVVFSWTTMEDTRFIPVQDTSQPSRTIGKNELLNPRFESRDNKSQPYTITADRAIQGREEHEDLILLEKPLADLMMNNNHWLALKANQGLFNQANHNLRLNGEVELYHDAGYQMNTEELVIDMASSTAVSDKPVSAHGPAGKLEAKGLHADQKAGTLSFTGPAKLLLTMAGQSNGLQGVFSE